ncbi:MAG: hypothetical protein K2X55_21255 [Burkholderiaceae bacterium]|nr:hypothetical protein [Burkholderiaceae bacterium]
MRRRSHAGFTLLEMALVLFASGFLLMSLSHVANQAKQTIATQAGSTSAEQGKLSFNGFIQTHHRLPCPAASVASGVEDCTRNTGYVPYRTLGLTKPLTNAQGFDLWYAVRDELTVATDYLVPTYKDSTADYTSSVDVEVHNINLLDFCARLRDAAVAAPSTARVNLRSIAAPGAPINVAWVLVDPGAGDANQDANRFDLQNRSNGTSLAFESTARPKAPDYDDTVVAGGLHQLSAELNCPSLLAAISAAAREADFANENWRTRAFLKDFSDFDYNMRVDGRRMADIMADTAKVKLGLSVAMSVMDLAKTLAGPAPAAAMFTSLLFSVPGLVLTGVNMTQAIEEAGQAADEVTEAVQRKSAASAALAEARTQLTARRQALLQLDQRGGVQ